MTNEKYIANTHNKTKDMWEIIKYITLPTHKNRENSELSRKINLYKIHKT